jgi:hypothetical protein
MKDLAKYIQIWTPFLSDNQRYKILSWLHLYYLQVIPLSLFFFGNIVVKVFVLIFIAASIFTELMSRECPVTILEREFSQESWDDILDIIFKKFNWTITRPEKIVGFTCFNIALLLSLCMFTLVDIFKYTIVCIC